MYAGKSCVVGSGLRSLRRQLYQAALFRPHVFKVILPGCFCLYSAGKRGPAAFFICLKNSVKGHSYQVTLTDAGFCLPTAPCECAYKADFSKAAGSDDVRHDGIQPYKVGCFCRLRRKACKISLKAKAFCLPVKPPQGGGSVRRATCRTPHAPLQTIGVNVRKGR